MRWPCRRNNHPHEAQVQRYAASALKNLSSDNSENKLLIARDGGIEALIAAIVHESAEPEVQQYAAGALQNIAANNAFTKSEVVRHGVSRSRARPRAPRQHLWPRASF